MKNAGPIKILAIETSCDETAAAVIGVDKESSSEQPIILSSIVSSQIDLHAKTGGVVPEVASRAHMESILPVIQEALQLASTKSEIRNPKQMESNTNVLNINNSNLNIVSKFDIGALNLLQDCTHLAVTAGPGLIGSLLVGFNTAKALAYSLDIPIIPINHIEGHIYSAFGGEYPRNKKQETNNLTIQQFNNEPKFPILALTVSGGHTSLTLMKDHGIYENIGYTLDDAAGEAFDKVAKLLDLGYPGGPVVSSLAKEFRDGVERGVIPTNAEGSLYQKEIATPSTRRMAPQGHSGKDHNDNKIVFPRPILNDGTFNFSFSGLKTSVLTKVKQLTANGESLSSDQKTEICCAFEDAVVDVLTQKTLKACESYNPKSVILAGGVAANKRLRKELSCQLKANSYDLILPSPELCGDNAAMIGVAAYYHILKNDIKSWDQIKVDSNLKL